MRKIFVVGDAKHYSNWMEGINIDNIEDADLVVFTGGEDVSPYLYNEETHPFTMNNRQRDEYEVEQFKRAKELNLPCIGICRGSQLLNVLSGGRLIQHQDNPSYIHPITVIEDGEEKVMKINSTHHQAQYPFELPKEDYVILGWTNGISEFHEDGNRNEMNPEVECEIVYYKKTNCLCIQGHPEALNKESEIVKYLQNLLTNFLEGKI